MVNRWSEDDDIGGYGLLEQPVAVEKVSKRDPKTRFQRPKEDWTAMDVASEFSSRVYQNVRGIPGLVNTRSMMLVLAANRKKHGITAEIELKLMDKFFADARNINLVKKFPRNTIGSFMSFITNNIMSVTNEPTIEQAHQVAEEIEYLVASDGKRFDKSMPGRVALEEYEQSLQEEK